MSDLRQRAEKRVDAKIKFYKNFTAYVAVNAILAVINWIVTPEFWWVMFPVFFWGIGVFVDFLKAFVLTDKFESEDYRERKIQEEMEKLRE
ncbi:MAG: 2TM domain-containing protein [Methanobrevibacter sp.]|uniref:2TM domain-containing protein n=1 Tax=Methanobrevibacter sp. TaxID=66852 RepID=UPI001D6722D9|nr:2TM domain-containing protein [Methanobrevibacter sp.]MBE6490173.1 2TM domain-containing protein [Methanobrevibacter sp.]MEE0901113.1 2TM domain-containing protein [Methanobrevibacter sp.]MEE0936318.1 2TM domain-containing protein [Methanobrevibacter sp.]